VHSPVDSKADVKSSGGGITLENLEGDQRAKTSGGSISVTVPEEGGYDINLDGTRVRVKLANFDGDYEKDKIKGTLNGGGIRLTAKTSGGTVTMKYF